jgi:hypothetical protein
VHVPLPPLVVDTLEACPHISERHWFWTGGGSKDTLAGNRCRTLRRLSEIAGARDGHPHRFRDTLAVELPGRRPDRAGLGSAWALFGKFTERHDAPWVQARQAQLEADVARAWRNDPIAQAEMPHADMASKGSPRQRMGNDISGTRKQRAL